MTVATIKKCALDLAYDGSYYTITGCDGALAEWVTGVEGLLAEAGLGKPVAWFQTTGGRVNRFAGPKVAKRDEFPSELNILMFPLDGLDLGGLAMFKMQMRDRWFDDIIDNMRRTNG